LMLPAASLTFLVGPTQHPPHSRKWAVAYRPVKNPAGVPTGEDFDGTFLT